MTREEAIDLLDNLIGFIEDNHGSDYDKALKIAIKALEQKNVLDKIRVEINELPSYVARFNGGAFAIHIDKEKVFEIIDKYRGVKDETDN